MFKKKRPVKSNLLSNAIFLEKMLMRFVHLLNVLSAGFSNGLLVFVPVIRFGLKSNPDVPKILQGGFLMKLSKQLSWFA
jgi:hypothetical protein